MIEEIKVQGPTPPYVAYKTFKNFVRGLTQGVPSRIDKSVMSSLAGGTQSQILHALKYLNLITATGTPNEALYKLAGTDEAIFKKTLYDTLIAQYPFLSMNTINLATATMHQLEETFGRFATGDTVRKCLTFFIPAAKDAGITLSPYIKEFGKHTRNSKPKKQRAAGAGKGKSPQDETEEKITPPAAVTQSWQEMMLAKFPSFDPAWPDDVKAKWFESFEKLMQQGKGNSS